MSRGLAGVLLLVAIIGVARGGPHLHLAFEDRGDPRPHQFAMDAGVGAIGLALVISWSRSAVPR